MDLTTCNSEQGVSRAKSCDTDRISSRQPGAPSFKGRLEQVTLGKL
jgi:hypothetical protein